MVLVRFVKSASSLVNGAEAAFYIKLQCIDFGIHITHT